jgi:hypothetical protein
VVDLEVPGAVSSYGLSWSRTLNSRAESALLYQPWRHQYSWRLKSNLTEVQAATQLALNALEFREPTSVTADLPDARKIVFSRPNLGAEFLRGPAGVQERLRQVPGTNQFYILLSDGGQVPFERSFALTNVYYDAEYRVWIGYQVSTY